MIGGWRPESKLPRSSRQKSPGRSLMWHNIVKSLNLRKACGIYLIPNEYLRHLPRKPLVHLTHLFNHCHALTFPDILEENENNNLPKSGREPKFPQNVRPVSLLYMTSQEVKNFKV
jgi:hypothetical protein